MRSPRTLVGRVALHGALTGTIAGCAVAGAMLYIADQMTQRQEDLTLRDMCAELALELRERDADPAWVAEDEAWEFSHTGITVAVFERDRRIAGDPALAPSVGEQCADQGPLRVCSVAAGPLTALVGRVRPSFMTRSGAVLHAAWIAVALLSILSGVSARWLAERVVRPLRELRDSVANLPAAAAASTLEQNAGVSEVDALRTALRDTLAKLGTSLEQAERFARDAAHELRTPLTAMIGELELIAEGAGVREREDVLRVLAIAERQVKLVERLLVLAQQEVTEIAEQVDLADVLETAVETLGATARARVALRLPARATFVEGDSALLVSMVGNALDNALKFSERAVRCTLEARAQHALIAVHDDGPGIDEGERERVFLPFYRSTKARSGSVRGHGVGLALIAHVAGLHGGAARFVDAAQGARLEIDLPLVRVELPLAGVEA